MVTNLSTLHRIAAVRRWNFEENASGNQNVQSFQYRNKMTVDLSDKSTYPREYCKYAKQNITTPDEQFMSGDNT